MSTFQVITRPDQSQGRTPTGVEDALASELFCSDREAGVACFAEPEDEIDEDA
jgi:hypothetical protein